VLAIDVLKGMKETTHFDVSTGRAIDLPKYRRLAPWGWEWPNEPASLFINPHVTF
jgi:hypothetical protein